MSETPTARLVAARLKAMQHEFKDADEFIKRLVDASLDQRQRGSDRAPNRQKRLSYLRTLKNHETDPDDFDFDSLQQDRLDLERELKANHRARGEQSKYRAPKTFFDLLNMLAEGKLRDADRVPRAFPDWLLHGFEKLHVDEAEDPSLETQADEIDVPNETNESEEPDHEKSPDGETEDVRDEEHENPEREDAESDWRPDRETEDVRDEEQESLEREAESERGGLEDESQGIEERDEERADGDRYDAEDGTEDRADVEDNDEDLQRLMNRLGEARDNDEQDEERDDERDEERDEEQEDDDQSLAFDEGRRMSVGGKEVGKIGAQPSEEDEQDEQDEELLDDANGRPRRVSVGARSFELSPAQRVALHFATPGDSSRDTMAKFIKIVQPNADQGALAALDVSNLREYAYDLWLAQTDDELFELADRFSGNTGAIHPVIQQELEDTVRKYQQQLKDVNENGQRAVQKLKARASTLPPAEQLKFDTCLKEVEKALNQNEVRDKTQCTQINPADKATDKEIMDMARKPTKWLIRDPTNLSQAKFLTDMSAAELQKFSNYLVSQSAVGNCRMSQYLRSLADTCEKDIQQTKDDGGVPDIDKIETLRFIEWVLRRPVNPKNDTSVPLWLLRYPYVEGVQMEGKLPLSAKYRKFNPKTPNEDLLASIFKATNAQNVRIMKLAYNKRFTEAF